MKGQFEQNSKSCFSFLGVNDMIKLLNNAVMSKVKHENLTQFSIAYNNFKKKLRQ